jgi:ubiquinol oxidase
LSNDVVSKETNDDDNNDDDVQKKNTATTNISSDRGAVYDLNKAFVETMHNAVCFLYPTSTKSTFFNNKNENNSNNKNNNKIINNLEKFYKYLNNNHDNDNNDSARVNLERSYRHFLSTFETSQRGKKPTTKASSSYTASVGIGEELHFERFYVLESLARAPYFAYLDVNQWQEVLRYKEVEHQQQRDDNDYDDYEIKMATTQYRAENNPLSSHHRTLSILKSCLGDDNRSWKETSVAHSVAFVYYWYAVFLCLLNNEQALNHLNELIEEYRYQTYDEFLSNQERRLKSIPVPAIARTHYERNYRNNAISNAGSDSYNMKNKEDLPRAHRLRSLYDVFRNIRDDEKKHQMVSKHMYYFM